MIFKSRSNINDKLWNNCIASAINSLVYATTWYLDALIESWDAFVWEKEGIYIAVFPIPNRSRFGINYVYPPFFIQQLGVFSTVGNIENYTEEVLFLLEDKYNFIELNLNWKSGKGEERTNLILKLNKSFDQLKQNFSSNHKRNIKKSKKHNFIYRANIEVAHIIKNFRIDKGAEISIFREQDYHNFLNLCEVARNQSLLITRGLFEGDKLISGAVFIKFGNRLIFLFSGNSDKGKVSGGLFNLLNLVIEEFSGSNLILDFEGSSDEGLKRFYAGFGGNEENYFFYKKNNLPKVVKWLKK
tara:strand:+ start:3683 stop:4582 length:900 start_codon:yes stop_codon:yes gene_type:complete